MTISVSTFSASSPMPCLGLLHAPPSFERERPRDDADRERLELAGDLRDDRRTARAGAAALAGGDEDHVRALQRFLQLVARLERGLAADVRVGAGTEAARRFRADVDLHVGVAHQERLRVRVHRDELDAGQACVDHLVDRVRPPAADADDLDHGQIVAGTISHLDKCSTSSSSAGWGCRAPPSFGRVRTVSCSVNVDCQDLDRPNPQPQPPT